MQNYTENVPQPSPSVSASSSFDSNHSFYSTDSSSSASLTAGLSILDEDKFDQEYRQEINEKMHEFIAEVEDDSLFQPLLNNLTTVKVDTNIKESAPFCFRTCADFEGFDVKEGFALFADVAGRASWDSMCHEIRILRRIDPLTFIYHLQLKATWPTTARDSLALVAFRKLSDGRYVSVAWSIVDDELCPPHKSGQYIRMNTRISGNLFTPLKSGFRLNQLIDGDPKGNIPAYLIKKVSAKSFPDTIEAIKRVLGERKSSSTLFYENIIETPAETTEDIEIIPINETDSKVQLKDIQNRLHKLECLLEKSESKVEGDKWIVWTSLAISSLNLLLLLNLNLRKK